MPNKPKKKIHSSGTREDAMRTKMKRLKPQLDAATKSVGAEPGTDRRSFGKVVTAQANVMRKHTPTKSSMDRAEKEGRYKKNK